jgi:hypothetical protein
MNSKVSHQPSQPHSNSDKLTVPLKALNAGYQMQVSKPVEPVELITIVTGLWTGQSPIRR